MSSPNLDVIILGAGAAGLAALLDLDRAGKTIVCLEARDRIGGRISTVHDPLCPLPIELGAEFIHGRPPETWELVRSAALPVYDCAERSVDVRAGVVQHESSWDQFGNLMHEMEARAANGPDVPFSTFLEQTSYKTTEKQRAAAYVEGLNAADKNVIGIASLALDAQAAKNIYGDRSFRFATGYDNIPRLLLQGVRNSSAKLWLNRAVTHIAWRAGSATVSFRSPFDGEIQSITASRVISTIPLGVLQAPPESPGAITWDPIPSETLEAVRALAFGQVYRVILRFREALWEKNPNFADAGFVFSDENLFPTWWTPLSVRVPLLTGWSAGSHADALTGKAPDAVVGEALTSLSRILSCSRVRIGGLLERAYFHDWYADPFSRGAYSYVPAGALPYREKLAEPVNETLYFAGEATELNGHSATVHGAIASGRRAAQSILSAR